MDECDAKTTDDRSFLAILEDLDQSRGQRGWGSAFASGHWRYVALERSQFTSQISTCVMSQMECGHPGGLENFLGVISVAMKIANTIQPVIGLLVSMCHDAL